MDVVIGRRLPEKEGEQGMGIDVGLNTSRKHNGAAETGRRKSRPWFGA